MKLLIAGDYCPQERVAKLIETDRGASVLKEMEPYLSKSDYSIVNFECAVTNDTDKPIVKMGPCLSCSDKEVTLLKTLGFDCVTLANNHFRDYGNSGVRNTLQALKENMIDYVGGGENIAEAEKVLYKVIDGKTIAIVNFCENEFSIATKCLGGSAPMNAVINYHQITEAKQKADVVIVIIHGGHEGYQFPTLRMRQLYRWYVELGANMVVNGHQHCFSGYEIYKGAPIVYGLGNFCFDEKGSRNDIWNFGYFLDITIDGEEIHFECIPYEQCNAKPVVRILKGQELEDFHLKLNKINSVLSNEETFEAHDKAFKEKNRGYVSCLSPYFSKYSRAAARHGWIPFLLPKKKLLSLLNFIRCESHRDLLINALMKQIYHDEEIC